MGEKAIVPTENIYSEIRKAILEARSHVYTAANAAIVQTYWNIGHIIVEYEQEGNERAEYGKRLMKALSKRLTGEFGKRFDERNMRNMRSFYQIFPKWNAMRSEFN